jgi:predicted amidohydrolase YtcJ
VTGPTSAELIVSGRIATLAGPAGPGWVEGIAITGGRVVAAGDRAAVDAVAGRHTRRLVLGPDEVAIPGLTDAHLHLVDAALARLQVDLEGITSPTELVRRVAAARGAPGGADPDRPWITGGGWDPDLLGAWPSADELERVAPGRLVALWAHDHHALLVSPAALAAAGIDDDRPDPAGGVIRRGPDGQATGVLHENAARLVADRIASPAGPTVDAAVTLLVEELVALGVVAVHDPGGLWSQHGLGVGIGAYRRLAAAGALGVRVHACVRPEQLDAALAGGLRSGGPLGADARDRLRMGWLKTFADGSLGSRTAALLAPLEVRSGEPGVGDGRGVWLTPPDALRTQVERAAAGSIATQVHAIGDAAVAAALEVLAPTAGRLPLMPRIEHAQLVDEGDIGRFASLGIAASVQPVHLRSDAAKARRLWGARADERAFPLASLDRMGAVIAFGTDAPVEPIDPWPGIACAVTRAAPSWPPDTAPLGPQHAIGLWRALRAACVDAAVSAGERDRGRLVPGHRADLVVLPAAAVQEPVGVGGALWEARPRAVLIDGELVAGGG